MPCSTRAVPRIPTLLRLALSLSAVPCRAGASDLSSLCSLFLPPSAVPRLPALLSISLSPSAVPCQGFQLFSFLFLLACREEAPTLLLFAVSFPPLLLSLPSRRAVVRVSTSLPSISPLPFCRAVRKLPTFFFLIFTPPLFRLLPCQGF